VSSRRAFGILILSYAVACCSAAHAETAIATKWRLVGESQNECMAHARMAIFRSGFDVGEAASESMTGKHGDYTALIRCIADQKMVVFVSSGPSSDTTLRYLEVLYGHF